MKPTSRIMQSLPLDMVGSTVFGRYPKISVEQTFNMIISDNWLVPSPGYKVVSVLDATGEGRGIYTSIRLGKMIVVSQDGVYQIDSLLSAQKLASIATSSGDVFIAENNANQIAICDRQNIYIYNWVTGAFTTLKGGIDLPFLPGYIEFQDGYFIACDQLTPRWFLSAPNNGLSWPAGANNVGSFQTKPDKIQAAVRMPGKGNLLYVFGNNVTESWYDVGLQLFPYQRSSVANFDFGCANPASIATNKSIVVWVGINEKSGPVIMYSNGGQPQSISTDGIDFRLSHLKEPNDVYGFLFMQDGHMIYQATWPADNITLIYDFNTSKFFTLMDENQNFHIAKRVTYFNGSYYFVSFVDGNVYNMDSNITTYDGEQIPRIRITKTIRMPDTSPFICNNMTFPIEQGEPNPDGDITLPAVDLSISRDGGQNFSSPKRYELNAPGIRQNRFIAWDMGRANELTPQFNFWSTGRFVVGNGLTNIYQ